MADVLSSGGKARRHLQQVRTQNIPPSSKGQASIKCFRYVHTLPQVFTFGLMLVTRAPQRMQVRGIGLGQLLGNGRYFVGNVKRMHWAHILIELQDGH